MTDNTTSNIEKKPFLCAGESVTLATLPVPFAGLAERIEADPELLGYVILQLAVMVDFDDLLAAVMLYDVDNPQNEQSMTRAADTLAKLGFALHGAVRPQGVSELSDQWEIFKHLEPKPIETNGGGND